jgi:hypothetical protein
MVFEIPLGFVKAIKLNKQQGTSAAGIEICVNVHGTLSVAGKI